MDHLSPPNFNHIVPSKGAFISIGAMVEEPQDVRCIHDRANTRSRQLLILVWLVGGYLLSVMYKSGAQFNTLKKHHEKHQELPVKK